MLKMGWLLQLQQVLLCILAFAIPFPFIYATLIVIALSIAWLLNVRFSDLADKLKHRRALWPWLLYFILFAVSYFYSNNKSVSAFDLQKKLSILLLPLVIGAGIAINKKLAERIFLSFIAGISVAAIICMGNALYSWYHTADTSLFFYPQPYTTHDRHQCGLHGMVYVFFAQFTVVISVGGLY
jgi:hypothetical protein